MRGGHRADGFINSIDWPKEQGDIDGRMNEKIGDIQLITMTLDEVERARNTPSASTIRRMEIVSGAMPPDIVFASAVERFHAGEQWFWSAPRFFVLPAENRIIGSGCFKNSPRDGAVEIGCGVAESHRGRNFATQGVELLVTEGFSQPEVTVITAETADWNIASQRVLEKASFRRSGSRVDAEDGLVITWRRERITG